jgi:uncharacterized protein
VRARSRAHHQSQYKQSQEEKYMSQKLERRFCKATLRTSDDDEDEEWDPWLEGIAASYRSESQDFGGWREVINPGAFTRALKEGQDIRCLRNHDPNFVLGRSKSGTLQLRDTPAGLSFRCTLDRSNPEHMAVRSAIRRGDMDSCSFAFMPQKQEWSDKRDADGNTYALRTLHDVDLQDVSVVTYPAYPNGTSVNALRSLMFVEGIPSEIETRGGRIVVPKVAPTKEEILNELNSVRIF